MSVRSGTIDRLGWTYAEAGPHWDALPLLDEPIDEPPGEAGAPSRYRLQWLPAAIALTLFLLARFDLLPAMPW